MSITFCSGKNEMIEILGKTQQELLRQLHKQKLGLTIDQLGELLGVTRNAVKQHLSALKKDNLVEHGKLFKTAGRPTQNYILTSKGMEYFPRQYSWLAEIMLDNIRAEKNEKGLLIFLRNLGNKVSSKYLPAISKLNLKDRLNKVATIMSELGYEAQVVASNNKTEVSKIEISNCVFHQVAISCPEVCTFDLSLISQLTGKEVEHTSSIALGSNVCCFGIKK